MSPVLFLTESDVAALVDMDAALGTTAEAFRQLSAGQATNVPRVRAKGGGAILHTMSAASDVLGLAGWKAYTTTRQGAKFLFGMYETASGELVALVEADRLGQLRTGAATGVALQALGGAGIDRMGLLGTGHQAETQLEGAAKVCALSTVKVFSRNAERRKAFARRMGERLQLDVRAVDRPEEAVREMPLVITATSAAQPVLVGAELAEGAVVCAVGSNWPRRAEIDAETVRRAAIVVCDSAAACRAEGGDLLLAEEAGAFAWERAVELADLVGGKAPAEREQGAVAVFKSVGLAIEDLLLAARAVELARQRGVGREIRLME